YIVVIGGVFIFMTSRGNKKRQAQASQLQNALTLGAEVRTIGGLVGEVVEVTDEHVVIETTPDVRLKFIKSAIAGVVPPAEPETEEFESPELSEEADAEHEPEAAETGDAAAEPSDAVPAAAEDADAKDELHTASPGAKR
ncbi:MAG TPA: preprotein translocase subunit YajC, partial [Actinocrinis sp.]|nr:preprotein translocase subunit YajC [Actinocrinis sp.]